MPPPQLVCAGAMLAVAAAGVPPDPHYSEAEPRIASDAADHHDDDDAAAARPHHQPQPKPGVALNIASAQKGKRLGAWLGFNAHHAQLYNKNDTGGEMFVGVWELQPAAETPAGGNNSSELFYIQNKWHPAPRYCTDSRYGDWLCLDGNGVDLCSPTDLANRVPWALLPTQGRDGGFYLQSRWKAGQSDPRYGMYAGFAGPSPKPYVSVELVPEAQRVAWSFLTPTWRNPAPPCPPPPPPPPPPPTILSVSPRRVAVEGGDDLVVTGANLENITYCRLEAAAHSTSLQIHAPASFPATVLNNSALKCVGVPPVLVPGPAVLTLSSTGDPSSFQGGSSDFDSRVSFFSLVDAALDRRPYYSEPSGSLLLALDPSLVAAKTTFVVKAQLPCAGPTAVWLWPGLVANATEMALPLSFAVLPKVPAMLHNDLVVTITLDPSHEAAVGGGGLGGGPAKTPSSPGRTITMLRRFMRVPPPPNGSAVEPVQVDHAARSLRVGGNLFNPVGWYVESDIPLNDLRRTIVSEFAPRGVNVAMPYGLNSPTKHTVEELFEFLDACHAVGFKIWWGLESAIGPVNLQRGGPFDDDSKLVELKRQVELVKDHPAILGYYICDDCCGRSSDGSLQAQAYTLLKALDPYHATIGAMDCGDLWSFSDVDSYLNATAKLSEPALPIGQQPATQLSLDVLMYENYEEALSAHSDTGGWDGTAAGIPGWAWAGGLDNDGRLRHGVRWSPLVNCPGADPHNRHWTAPKFLRSDAWLAAVMLGAPAAQVWTFPAWSPTQSPGTYVPAIRTTTSHDMTVRACVQL
eukprot:SAG22_NODE_2102_length_3010_cov_2.033322_2_plen_803_part_00